MKILTVKDNERRCGWRKPGGLYLRASALTLACGKLPLLLDRYCACCGQALPKRPAYTVYGKSFRIRTCRGWTWVNAKYLADTTECKDAICRHNCLIDRITRAGLLWVGVQHYPDPYTFLHEVMEQGISRRLPGDRLPRGFEVGQTPVLLAHRRAKVEFHDDSEHGRRKAVCRAGVFGIFVPRAVEYVVKGDETDEYLGRLAKRGITPVKVIRDEQLQIEDNSGLWSSP